MMWSHAISLFALVTFSILQHDLVWADNSDALAGVESAFRGRGSVAMILARGPDRPDGDSKLVVITEGVQRQIDVESPRRVRWRTPEELIVTEFVSHADRASANRIIRVARDGVRLGVLSDTGELAGFEPSPDGSRLLVERIDSKGSQGLQVRMVEAFLPLESSHPLPVNVPCSLGRFVWSPDGQRFAAAIYMTSSKGPAVPNIAVARRSQPGYRLLRRETESAEPILGVPLWWDQDGIYARRGNTLVRCDVERPTCAEVYETPEGKAILTGTGAGPGVALILARDVAADVLEARAREVLELDLKAGTAHVVLKLPQDVFISDIDWIDDGK